MQQKIILNEFKKVFGDKSYRSISKITGIQNTRVFRIFNGSEMRVSEAEIFLELISRKDKDQFSKVFYKVYYPDSVSAPDSERSRYSLKLELKDKLEAII